VSADNVTPIGGNGNGGKPPKKSKCLRFHLAEPDDQPGNLRLIQALHGVCSAIERLAETGPDAALELGTAAEILSGMLQDRLNEVPS